MYERFMYARFTDRARKVMQLANQEAQRFNHEYIGTEHILLGLVKEGSGVAANVLKDLDIDLRKIRLEVEKIVQSGPDMVTMGTLPKTPRARKVIEYAIEEAKKLNHNYVGTEHLLLGLVREEYGVAAQVLMNLGLTMHDIRREVFNLLGHDMGQDEVGQKASTRPVAKNTPPTAERQRIRSLEQQLWYARIVLGVFAGGLISALAGGSIEAGWYGLVLGGFLPVFGWRFPGALVGCLTYLLLGSAQLRGEDGGLAGALLGVLVGTLFAVSFTSPRRYGQSILTAAVVGTVLDSPHGYSPPGCSLSGVLIGALFGIAIGEFEESLRRHYSDRRGRK